MSAPRVTPVDGCIPPVKRYYHYRYRHAMEVVPGGVMSLLVAETTLLQEERVVRWRPGLPSLRTYPDRYRTAP